MYYCDLLNNLASGEGEREGRKEPGRKAGRPSRMSQASSLTWPSAAGSNLDERRKKVLYIYEVGSLIFNFPIVLTYTFYHFHFKDK